MHSFQENVLTNLVIRMSTKVLFFKYYFLPILLNLQGGFPNETHLVTCIYMYAIRMYGLGDGGARGRNIVESPV